MKATSSWSGSTAIRSLGTWSRSLRGSSSRAKAISKRASASCSRRLVIPQRSWTYLGQVHNAIGYSDEAIELWLATGLTKGEAQLDEGEFLEVFTLPFDEALVMAADGRISDVKTIVGLFWASARR